MPSPTDHPDGSRHEPRQQRSREIVRAIVEACGQLLAKRDSESITTNHIAEAAGVSIGSLYRYFVDKDAVIAALYYRERLEEAIEVGEQVEHPMSGLSLREAITQLVDYQLDRHRKLIEMGDSFYRDHHREYSLAQQLGTENVADGMRRFLASHAEVVRVGDLDEAAFLVGRGVSAIVRIAVEEHPEKLDKPAFREELIDMLVRYLTAGN